MKRVCAWCNRLLAETTHDDTESQLVTHGICFDCVEKLNPDDRMRLRDFLDTLEAPVVMVDDSQQETLANTRARLSTPPPQRALGSHPMSVSLRPGSASTQSSTPPSEIRECIASEEPDGCQRHLHCAGCTIRRTVMQTYLTGEPLDRVPACQSRETPDEIERACYWVSTHLVDGVVLVQIATNNET